MKKNSEQKETVIDPNTSTVTTPRSQVNIDLRRHGMSPSSIPREIHTQLVYQGSTNKILNAYASVRFILIRRTPSQGPRTRNITKVYINSKFNILLTCFLLFFHVCPSNSKKHPHTKTRDLQKETVTSLFRFLNFFKHSNHNPNPFMILQVCTSFTLCHNSYISLEMFCFFCCRVLCSLSSLRFPDETQLSTARAASNSAIPGLFTDINITLFNVSFQILIFSFVFCLFVHSHVLQLIVIIILKSISMLSISSRI